MQFKILSPHPSRVGHPFFSKDLATVAVDVVAVSDVDMGTLGANDLATVAVDVVAVSDVDMGTLGADDLANVC